MSARNETTNGFEVLPITSRTTIAELATHHNCEYVEAAGFIRFLLSKGIVKLVDKRKAPGRGKPTYIYEIPNDLNMKLVA